MAHALEMYFDDQADAAVRELWQLLADAELPSLATRTHRRHRPHVSLAVAESFADVHLARLRSVLKAHQPTLHLHVLGTFPGDEGALFLGVQVTAELLAFHAEVHAALAGQPVEPSREREILIEVAAGLSNAEIAARDRVQAVVYAYEHGLVSLAVVLDRC